MRLGGALGAALVAGIALPASAASPAALGLAAHPSTSAAPLGSAMALPPALPRVGWMPRAPRPVEAVRPIEPMQAISSTAWLFAAGSERRWLLPGSRELALMQRWLNPAIERPAPWISFWAGPWGVRRWRSVAELVWGEPEVTAEAPTAAGDPELTAAPPELSLPTDAELHGAGLGGIELLPTWALDSAPAPHAGLLGARAAPECAPWQRHLPVTIGRYGHEYDTFLLLECDGSVAPDAIDRLSSIARALGVPRPELPLPLDPEPAPSGEWTAGLKMLHPRVLWLVQQIADAFPGRPVYVVSGYRRESPRSLHAQGRALDLSVLGVTNEELLLLCRKLRDVACGYYPNHNFLHVDVRPPGTGHPLWIDDSLPGAPSHYVDAWPGVVEGGALAWSGEE